MGECTEIQVLGKISTEVDKSQYTIILSSQCLKAQAFLTNKLHKESKQKKKNCGFINSGNLKLEIEIKLAKNEVKSLLSALDTIKTANVELQKELLIAKERKFNVIERVRNGIKKYDELWAVSKRRYESIPFIDNYLNATNKSKILQDNINNLNNEIKKISFDINIRKTQLLHLDRQYIIKFANFMINERPKIVQRINEKNKEIKALLKNNSEIIKGHDELIMPKQNTTVQQSNKNKSIDILMEDSWPNLNTDIDNIIRLPKLQLQGTDLDLLSVKLDKILLSELNQMRSNTFQIRKKSTKSVQNQHPVERSEIKKVDAQSSLWESTESGKNNAFEYIPNKKFKTNEMIKDLYVSSYFPTNNITEDKKTIDGQTKNYSNKKLIHILEDIKLDKAEAYNIVSKVKQSAVQDVNMIKAVITQSDMSCKTLSQEKKNAPIEEIQEVDLSQSKSMNILIPPSQFLDSSQERIATSQENIITQSDGLQATNFKNNCQERRVTFDAVVSVRNSSPAFKLGTSQETEIINDSPNNQLNISATSEDSYKKIKDIVFKKHNLELSPQFTYSKNTSVPLRAETSIITSKFFNEKTDEKIGDTNKVCVMEIDGDHTVEKLSNQQEKTEDKIPLETENIQITESRKESSVADILFTHGIPDSLNLSSTMGYEDMDSDFPQCIDSSLLLSPKAEEQLPNTSDNLKVTSPDVPNFLSGVKKGGFSFFGSTSSENAETAPQSQSNFTFSFGGNEKKGRGWFSMFR